MRKNLITGAAILALLMNVPQVSANDDVVIFGGEFEDEAASSAKKNLKKKLRSPNRKSPSKNLRRPSHRHSRLKMPKMTKKILMTC